MTDTPPLPTRSEIEASQGAPQLKIVQFGNLDFGIWAVDENGAGSANIADLHVYGKHTKNPRESAEKIINAQFELPHAKRQHLALLDKMTELERENARLTAALATIRESCPCNCHNQPSSKDAMGMDEHANCGECIRELLKESEDIQEATLTAALETATADERERAAKVCENLTDDTNWSGAARNAWLMAADEIRKAKS